MRENPSKEQRREGAFAQQVTTKICLETPTKENPYLTEKSYCHGYNLMELMSKRRFVDVFYLLFRSELPTAAESEILEQLMIALINPGPRHPATRAAMVAGVGKTDTSHLLPISLTIMGGQHLGGAGVEPAMRFLRKNRRTPAYEVAEKLISQRPAATEGDWQIAPGFGSRYNGIDPMPTKIAKQLLTLEGAGDTLKWACTFADAITPANVGWLTPGVAAAVLTDLGFAPRAGAGLFQIFCAPGLLAHAVEFASKPISAMPFPEDKDYIIEYQNR
ncbi:MAG: citrate synthase [Gammaproteobacteria bacterium]|nr:citrate synthase [Gammaproteobacteria bacterium]